MKQHRRLIRIALVTTVFGLYSAHASAQAVTEPCGPNVQSVTVVIFVNGVFNTPQDARENCAALARKMTSWRLAGSQMELFYNRTSKVTGCTTGARNLTGSVAWDTQCALDAQSHDLLEAARQLSNIAKNYPSASHPDAIRLGQAINDHMARGRRVVVVAHSQGNLMLQEALFGQESTVPDYRWRDIAWLSVAAPLLEDAPPLGDFHAVILSGDVLLSGQGARQVGTVIASRPMTSLVLFGRGVQHSPKSYVQGRSDEVLAAEGTDPITTHLFQNYLNAPASATSIEEALRRMLGRTIDPVNTGQKVLLVLDISGSMNEHGKLEAAKREALNVIGALPATAALGVLAFGWDCDVGLVTAMSADRNGARQAISSLTARGSTPLAQAMAEAADMINAAGTPSDYHVIIITDGMETCRGNWQRAAQLLGEALRLRIVP